MALFLGSGEAVRFDQLFQILWKLAVVCPVDGGLLFAAKGFLPRALSRDARCRPHGYLLLLGSLSVRVGDYIGRERSLSTAPGLTAKRIVR
ncbi:MAG TPA: hypothetical protein VNL14_02945 [Candidatus Acidoferrales bacterium]|nr:hypothetical protein [Candidatus Acidoferrales bacterium]